MKEYKEGFTTKASGGVNLCFGDEISVSTNDDNVTLTIIGDDTEKVVMNKKEVEMLITLLKNAKTKAFKKIVVKD